MRLFACELQGALVSMVGLVTLLLLLPFFFSDQGEIEPLHPEPLFLEAVEPLARSEALRQHLRNACKALQFPEVKKLSPFTLSHMIYDDRHKAIYCYIPKVACTSWKRVFIATTGRLPKGHNITSLNGGTTSAKGSYVTFPEFVRYITESGGGIPGELTDHWLPMHEVCSPCPVDYDFIGTKKNLKEDGNYVLRWLGMTKLVDTFPSPTNPVNADQNVRKNLALLNQTEVLAFYTKFLPDYALFDYKLL